MPEDPGGDFGTPRRADFEPDQLPTLSCGERAADLDNEKSDCEECGPATAPDFVESAQLVPDGI